MDLLRGAGQYLGLVSRQDVADSREQDAPLMATTPGSWGDFAGTVNALAPTALIPGANTLAGAAAIGAGSGALMPSTSNKETLSNVGFGALASPGGILFGRTLGALYQGTKAAVEPLFAGGQDRIAARTLQAFAGSPQDAAAAAARLSSPPAVLPGVQPTTAELAQNPGLSQLERSLRNNPEYMTALTNRTQANRSAMTSALGDIAGNDADRALEEQTRSALTAPLYRAAGDAQATSDDTLQSLLARPSLQSAWARARQLAAERGEALVEGKDIPAQTVGSPILDDSGDPFSQVIPAQSATYSGRAIQYLKMSLNDMLDQGEQRGMGAHELGALKSTRAALGNWIGDNVPALSAADRSFDMLSENLNQMDIGRALSNRLQPALADFGNDTRLNANSFANAARNGDQLAATATGKPNATLNDVLSLDQLRTVVQVGQQLARRANADELGRAVGSNTAQNLVSQNILRQLLGPLGLPRSAMERVAASSLGQSALRPLQFVGKIGEERLMGRLAAAALDPGFAGNLLARPTNSGSARALWQGQRLLNPPVLALRQSLTDPSQQ